MVGSGGPGPGTYAFGDSAVASRRLDVLASVFGPTSISLLDDLPLSFPSTAPTVLDLGCGPGHTTAMLADAFVSAEVVGIDASDAFVEEARSASAPAAATRWPTSPPPPLPGAPADLIYARFLVVHLPDPERSLARWAEQLEPGGLLVVEEPERIETGDDDFRRYLELAAAVVEARGGDLYAGRLLARTWPPVAATERSSSAAPRSTFPPAGRPPSSRSISTPGATTRRWRGWRVRPRRPLWPTDWSGAGPIRAPG